MARHAGIVTVSASGKTRDEAIARCCALVAEATGQDAHSSYSGRAGHWLLSDARADVVVAGARQVVAGVDVDATFVWRDAS